MEIRRSYKYRLYPTKAQEARLDQWCRALKWVWNAALRQRFHRLNLYRHGMSPAWVTYLEQQAQLTGARAEETWLADVPCACCQGVLRDLEKAWQAWLDAKTAGRPQYKGRRHTAAIFASAPAVRCQDGMAVFPKIGKIKMVQHRPVGGVIKTASITKDIDQWHISFSCVLQVEDPGQSKRPVVGIDRGVAVPIADSDGRLSDLPPELYALEARVAWLQSKLLSHKCRGSNNWRRAQVRLAKLRRRVRRIRAQWLHDEVNYYAARYGTIKVEKLHVRNMVKSSKGTMEEPGTNVAAKSGLNREILKRSWSAFVQMLCSDAELSGAIVIEVPAAYSSQTCAECGSVSAQHRRNQATFICGDCGYEANADVNAARVIATREGVVVGGHRTKKKATKARKILRRVKGTTKSTTAAPADCAS